MFQVIAVFWHQYFTR